MKISAKNWAEKGLFIFVMLMLVLGYLYVISPGLREAISPYQCLFHQATGLLCPACGGTRAMIHLLEGKILIALKSNVLAVMIMPVIFYGAITAFRLAFDKNFSAGDIRIAPVWPWAMLALVIIFWVVRNIPVLSFLRPPS
ncbi:MAG: DUF2752 domain-containing protein [Bacillota bacterium]